MEAASPVKKNLVIIIDRSGSMSGSRMRLAKDAALTVLDTLSPHDNVSTRASFALGWTNLLARRQPHSVLFNSCV